jgi:hypothetical protein
MEWDDATAKKCFSYFDGKEEVLADPVDCYERLVMALGANPVSVVNACYQGKAKKREEYPSDEAYQKACDEALQSEPLRSQARQKLREAVRIAFDMAPFNKLAKPPEPPGATASDCDKAIDKYFEYCEGQKKNGVAEQT